MMTLQTQQSFAEYLFAFVEYILSSDCNGIRNHNHLVHKRTLTHLGKLACLAKLASFANQKSQFG